MRRPAVGRGMLDHVRLSVAGSTPISTAAHRQPLERATERDVAGSSSTQRLTVIPSYGDDIAKIASHRDFSRETVRESLGSGTFVLRQLVARERIGESRLKPFTAQ